MTRLFTMAWKFFGNGKNQQILGFCLMFEKGNFSSNMVILNTPPKTNMEAKNGRLEDDFPCQRDDVHVPCQFSGESFWVSYICSKEIRRFFAARLSAFGLGLVVSITWNRLGQWSCRDDGWTNMGCEISGQKVDMKEMIHWHIPKITHTNPESL